MNSTLIDWLVGVPCVIISLYLAWMLAAGTCAWFNTRHLRVPDCLARDIFTIDWEELWRLGVRVIVFDVDLTLCGMHADRLPSDVVDLISSLKVMGFKIILATKSNPNLDSIRLQLQSHHGWLRTIPKASKSHRKFLSTIRQIVSNAKWFNSPGLDGSNYRIALVGDKLTDMGYDDGSHQVITILTNPKFGRDQLGEYFPALRRLRERITLTSMGVVRARNDRPEFRKTKRPSRMVQLH